MSRESLGPFASLHQAFSDSFDVIKARTQNEIPSHFVQLPSVENGSPPRHGFDVRESRLKFDRLQHEMNDLIRRIATATLGLMTIQEFPVSRVSGASGPGVQVRVESVHNYVLQFIELFQINSDNFFQIVRNDYFQVADASENTANYHGSIQRGTTTLQAVEFLERFEMAPTSVYGDTESRPQVPTVAAPELLPVDQFKTSLDKKVIVSEVMDGEQPSEGAFLESELEPDGLPNEHSGAGPRGNQFQEWTERMRGHKFLRSSFLQAVGDSDQNESFSSAVRDKLEGYYAKRLKPLKISEEESRNLSDINFDIKFSDFEDPAPGGARHVTTNNNSECLFSEVLDGAQTNPRPSSSSELFKKKNQLVSEVSQESMPAPTRPNRLLQVQPILFFAKHKPEKGTWIIEGPLQILAAGRIRFSDTFGHSRAPNLSLFCPFSPRQSQPSEKKSVRESPEKENRTLEPLFELKPPSLTELDSDFVAMALREFDARERFENSQRKLNAALKQLAILKGKAA